MENIISNEIIDNSNFSERRLIIYLMCKRGKVGSILRKPKGGLSLRLNALVTLVEKGIVKIVEFNDEVVYFKFTTNFDFEKISVSFGKMYKHV